jgi:DNA helicase-2/ATP-dependent DNA helicase PcrA
VLNCVDGCLPSDLATSTKSELEEERRLLYVAMTRAMDHLHLVVPQRFFVHQQRRGGDSHLYAARTRFIPSGIMKLFEQCAWPATGETATTRLKGDFKTVDVGARLRGMWR